MHKYNEICLPDEEFNFTDRLDFIATFLWHDSPLLSLQKDFMTGEYLIHFWFDKEDLGGTFKDSGYDIPNLAWYDLYAKITTANLRALLDKTFSFRDVLLQSDQVVITEHVNSIVGSKSYIVKDANLLGEGLPTEDALFDAEQFYWDDLEEKYSGTDRSYLLELFSKARKEYFK